MVRLEDLPPKLREQALQQMNRTLPAPKDRKGANRTTTDGVCWECGERFTSVTKWERHTAANPGHRRLELIAERPT